MKAVLLLTFQLSLATVILGDFLETPRGPAASRIASVEVDFTGPAYRFCGSYNMWVQLKKQNGYGHCYVNLGNPDHGDVVRKNVRNSRGLQNCRIEFDDRNNLPTFQIYSSSRDNFCLAHIKVRTENDQAFYFDFNGFWDYQTENTPLISRRSLSSNAQQIANLRCPTRGCPVADVLVYDTEVPSNHYCSINSNCNSVTGLSPGLRDTDNGFVCADSTGTYGLPKYCCRSSGHQGLDHCDDVAPRNNPPRNNRTTESAQTLGPYGTGPYINGRHLVGRPFTATGPFAKISIKTMPFGFNQATTIVKGIKTEMNNGTIQTFGMFENDTVGVSELIVPQGEHISEVKISYGWFIDQLGFVTNTNWRLGRVGQRSGSRAETVPRNFDSGRTLIGIEGELVNYEGAHIMTKLKFTFVEQNQPGGGQNGGGQNGGGENGGRQNGGGQRRYGQNGGGQNRGNGYQHYNSY